MIDARVQDLLNEVGLKASLDVHATIVGRDPVLRCRFPVGEAAAVALAACGVAVSDLWELKGGPPQRARVDVRRAEAAGPARQGRVAGRAKADEPHPAPTERGAHVIAAAFPRPSDERHERAQCP